MPYGRKLTNREYEKAIADLHSRASSMPSKSEDREIRKREFSLMIDHRLGNEFPKSLRNELWGVHERIEKKRLRMVASTILGKLSRKSRSEEAHLLADKLVNEYAKVIGRENAEMFFGLNKGERPRLPIDFPQ